MSGVAFHDAARQYAAAGIASLPLGGEDGKRPLVKRPQRFGIKASLEIAPKFPDANLGFWCGRRSNLTVVDIDSADESELRWTQDTFGRSPIIVRTGSGKFHAWYRHNGERRRIRPIEGHAIDLLGEGGYCVAPPSVRPNGGRYEFLQGNLDKVADLPTIRPEAMELLNARLVASSQSPTATPARTAASREIADGARDNTLFGMLLREAPYCDDFDMLLDVARTINMQCCTPPLDDAQVIGKARSAWKYETTGNNWVGRKARASTDRDELLAFAHDPEAHMVLKLLECSHPRPGTIFAIDQIKTAKLFAWDRKRVRGRLETLISMKWLKRVHQGRGIGDPHLYVLLRPMSRFGTQYNHNTSPSLLRAESGKSERGEFCPLAEGGQP